LPTVTAGTLYGVDGASLSESYTTANAGTNLTLTPTATFNPSAGAAGASNYAITYVNNTTGVINQEAVTVTPTSGQTKVYGTGDPTLAYTITNGTLYNGDQLSGALTRAGYGTLAGEQVGNYAIIQGTLAASANYSLVLTSGVTFTINAAPLSLAANAQSKVYGTNDPTLTYAETGLVNTTVDGVLINDTLSGSLSRADYGTLAGEQVGSYAISRNSVGVSAPNDYTVSYTSANLTITQATITYIADPAMVNYGTALPTFTGTVTGLVNGVVVDGVAINDNLGTAQFTTNATSLSPIGFYAINGSGLAADANYMFKQAASNATALQIGPALLPPYTPPNSPNNPPPNPVNIVFQNPNTGNLIHVGFTPNGPNTANNDNGVNPASLPPGDQLTHNNGFDFAPISQYDENQYSDFKLPDYDNDDSEAAILTILARGASPGHAQDYMIDNFWNGSEATWPGAGHINLSGKLTFSDGAGHNVTPTNDNGFPIVAGKTDFAALLKNGPVMIGGPPGQTPAQWLLATGMTPDGKDIICDDPATGGLVELAYDPATETVGGITGVFNPKTKGFIALADAGTDIPANDASGLAGLQSFVPSTYYAVTVH
jgi:hypothetical protein